MVQDIPLLVEGGMAAQFPLVVVVHADAPVRVRRLVEQRGMPEADARARIAAQADDAARRAVADVWLDNSGRARRRSPRRSTRCGTGGWCRSPPTSRPTGPHPSRTAVVDPDPEWPAQAARLVARVEAAAGERGRGVAHVGPTAVPGLPAADVLDLLLGVASPADADALRGPLAEVGFVPAARPGYASADPGRPARLQVREVGSPGWRAPSACGTGCGPTPQARAAYAGGSDDGAREAAAAAWAASSGWAPSLNGTTPDELTGPGRNTALRTCDGQTGPVRDRVTPARRTSRRGMPRGARGGADMGDDTIGGSRSAGRSTDTVLASPEAIAPEDDATVSALDEPRNGHRSPSSRPRTAITRTDQGRRSPRR